MLLDRFRTQSRQKHPDPAVRLAYISELPLTERDQIVAIAREDDDAGVRRAAVAKLMDPALLAAIARDDADESVRGQALAMLRDIALDSFEGVSEVESLAAVDALDDLKTLAHIAKTSLREEVGRRALARVADSRAVASVARQAALEPIRQTAFTRLQDRIDIVSVAMNSEFRDTAVTAVERLSDPGDLEQVAARAKNKSAAKRARAILRELTEQAAHAGAAASENPAASSDEAPSAAEQEARRRREDEARQRQEDDARRAEEQARRRDAEAAAERARLEAERLAQEEAGRQAARAAQTEAERAAARQRGRLAELVQEADAAAAELDVAVARRRLGLASREWKDLTQGLAPDAELSARFAEAEARMTEREAKAREAEKRVRRDALNRLHQLLGRVEPLAARVDLSLKAAERGLRDLKAALADIPPLPSRADYLEVSERLKAAQAALTPKVQELREVTAWQRWANIGIQEQLCEKMEALAAVADPEEMVHRIRDLQQQWRQAADVPRPQGELLWRRFKTAHDELWTRCEAHFAAQAQARAANLAKKTALCEQAEALADSTHWITTADEIKRLQAEWKTIGAVTRGEERTAWDRFRTACDRFFTRRHEDLVKRKAMWAENLAKKEALCARAEALADSTDWEPSAAQMRRLQAEWKTIGPVKKNRSEAIWQRFRAASDKFFARYAQRHDIARAERVAAREAICLELEALAPAPEAIQPVPQDAPADVEPAATPADVVAKVRSLRARWHQELAARGVDPDRAAALDRRFADAFARVLARWPAAFTGTDLDPDANRKRMEALVKRVEDLAASLGGAGLTADSDLSPTTRLAAMLKEALAANTIGGKVDVESRRRAAQEDVRQAQASWSRIGPVADDMRRALVDRFQRACRRVMELPGAGGAGRAGEAGR